MSIMLLFFAIAKEIMPKANDFCNLYVIKYDRTIAKA